MLDFRKRISSNISGLILIVITAVVVWGVVWSFKNSEEFRSFTNYITGKIEQQKKSTKFIPKESFLVLQIGNFYDEESFLKKSFGNSVDVFGVSINEFIDVFSINKNQDISISLLEENGKAEIVAVFRIYNEEKYKELKKKLKESKKITDDMMDGFYFAEKTNCLILSTSKDLLSKSIDQNFADSIAENAYWKNAQLKLSRNSELKITIIPNNLSKEANYLDYFILELFNDANNYKIQGKIVGNEDKMKEMEIRFNTKQDKQFALYKDIAKENLLFLLEGSHLNEEIETAQDVIKIENQSFYDYLQVKKEHLLQAASIDFDNDILSWMNDNYLLALYQNTTNQIPDFSLVFDIKTAESKANDFFKDANNFLKLWVNTSPDFTGKSRYKTIADNLFAFDFSDIYPLFRDSFTFTYGITDENLLIFSTLPEVEQKIKRETYFISIPESLKIGQNLLLLFPNMINNKLKIEKIFIGTTAQEYEINLKGVLEILQES